MGRKSSIDRLEPEIKAYIQAMLASGSMTLDELIADLRERWPAQSGSGDLPSRSALHRYGSKLDRRLTAIRASTEAALPNVCAAVFETRIRLLRFWKS